MPTTILTDKSDIQRQQLGEAETIPLAEGEARLRIRRFALTANNVTYAATGDVIGYWKFFPTGIEGQGVVPVWGVADVTESRAGGVTEDQAYYGFFPMGEELVIRPRLTSAGVVIDAAGHRADLPAVYNAYMPLETKRKKERDHLRALLQPLIATSYLLFDWLMDNDWFGAEQIIVGSASSKTGLGLLKFLAGSAQRPYQIIALTSERNNDFVEALGAADRVVTYDAVETVARVPTVYVDMAGDTAVKVRLHTHLADNMIHSAAVGTSHWDKFTPPVPMPGAKPRFFFAPSQIAKRREEWGPGVIERKIEEATMQVASNAGQWLTIQVHDGLQGAMAAYADLAKGSIDPGDGHVVEL